MFAFLFKKKLLTDSEELILMNAIKLAELQTSGEVRVHIEKSTKMDVTLRAQQIFKKMNMHQTKNRNAILFYVALNSKQYAVWGDEGIHQKVTQQFWDSISLLCANYFKQDKLVEGLAESIKLCGEQLKHYFPYQSDDVDELNNDISY